MNSETTETENRNWIRARINGTITLATEMCLADGNFRSGKAMDDGNQPEIMTVAKDVNGKPMIPAPTLKGALRDRMVSLFSDDEVTQSLFGRASQADTTGNGTDDAGLGGSLEVGFAFVQSMSADLLEIKSVAIDRVTGAAADRLLYGYESVPVGTVFSVELMVERPTGEHLSRLLAVLENIDDSLDSNIRFGGHSTNRRGSANWELSDVRAVDDKTLENWFNNEDADLWSASDAVTITPAEFEPEIEQLRIDIDLQFDRWFMVRDPDHVKQKSGEDDHSGVDAVPLRREGKVLLPSTGFKGALRSHLEKIARTIDADAGGDPVRDNTFGLVEVLFGSAGNIQCKGAVVCSDFVDSKVANELNMGSDPDPEFTSLIRREFVAIDRFTGGAAESFKFSALPAWQPKLCGTVTVNSRRLASNAAIYDSLHEHAMSSLEPALGLLALALRDLCDGEITFGMGSSKGFGTNQAVMNCTSATDNSSDYVKSLFDHIDGTQPASTKD